MMNLQKSSIELSFSSHFNREYGLAFGIFPNESLIAAWAPEIIEFQIVEKTGLKLFNPPKQFLNGMVDSE